MFYKSPPPIAAIQRSRCILAISVIKMYVTEIDLDSVSPELKTRLLEILSLLKQAQKTLPTTRLSAGAMRDLGESLNCLHRQISFAGKSGDNLFYAWGCAMWCAMSLHDDCMATCPAYYRGWPWMRLNQALEELCLTLEVINPKIGEDGFKIYEKVAL